MTSHSVKETQAWGETWFLLLHGLFQQPPNCSFWSLAPASVYLLHPLPRLHLGHSPVKGVCLSTSSQDSHCLRKGGRKAGWGERERIRTTMRLYLGINGFAWYSWFFFLRFIFTILNYFFIREVWVQKGSCLWRPEASHPLGSDTEGDCGPPWHGCWDSESRQAHLMLRHLSNPSAFFPLQNCPWPSFVRHASHCSSDELHIYFFDLKSSYQP